MPGTFQPFDNNNGTPLVTEAGGIPTINTSQGSSKAPDDSAPPLVANAEGIPKIKTYQGRSNAPDNTVTPLVTNAGGIFNNFVGRIILTQSAEISTQPPHYSSVCEAPPGTLQQLQNHQFTNLWPEASPHIAVVRSVQQPTLLA